VAIKARASLLFAVDVKLLGKLRASNPAPKCCWMSAASAVLKLPVGPQRRTEKSAPPRIERKIAPNASALAILSRKPVILSSGIFHESVATSLLTSGHLDGIQVIRSHHR
jgi:hypothetical protein